MRNYEIMYIVRPDIEEKDMDDVSLEVEKYLNNLNAKDIKTDKIGQRDLAYEVKNYKTGYYYLVTFTIDSSNIKELERVINLNENIIRHITIKR